MQWVHNSNCDPQHVGCYKKAATEMGIRLKIGPPSSAGLSYMRGVYTEPLSREQEWKLTDAYFRFQREYENDPDKPEPGSLPPWLTTAWIVCGACWVLVVMAWVSRS